MRIKHLLVIIALLALVLPASHAYAGGVITVCDEAHLLTALAGGGAVTFACSGVITLTNTITIATDTTIEGSGQDVTISGNHAVRVLTVNTGIMLNLNGITVAHGSALVGGGIVNNGMLTVNHSTVSGNSGGENYGAGGIQNNGTLIVNNSIFSGNTADSGGGILNNGTLTVSNSTFSSNSVANEGGAIFNGDRGTLTVSNSTFSGNSATYHGGAISNRRSYFYFGTVTVTNSTFSGNSSAHGGGIQSNGTLTVSNSTFSSNTADSGGGIGAVTLTVSNSTFFGNSASLIGGGIAAFGWMSVTNSTFSGNSAANGGGIHNSQGTLTVSSSTFPGNSATWDGGTYGYNGNTAILRNTIVANSPAGGNCFGAIIDGGGNLSYPDASCPGINADPRLGPLQDNGGPTWTMALGPGSAAIDAGDDAICAADPVNNVDQRGIARPQGAHCDSGALEQLRLWLPLLLANN